MDKGLQAVQAKLAGRELVGFTAREGGAGAKLGLAKPGVQKAGVQKAGNGKVGGVKTGLARR